MKSRELLRILSQNYCILKRHGSNHDIYLNTINNKSSPIPRHTEIKDSLCKLIFQQLGIDR